MITKHSMAMSLLATLVFEQVSRGVPYLFFVFYINVKMYKIYKVYKAIKAQRKERRIH